jgi:hypothetical protein
LTEREFDIILIPFKLKETKMFEYPKVSLAILWLVIIFSISYWDEFYPNVPKFKKKIVKAIFFLLGCMATLSMGVVAKWWEIPSNKTEVLSLIVGLALAVVFAAMHTYEKNKIPKGITFLQRLQYSPGIVFRLTLVLLVLSSLFALIIIQLSP